MDPPQLSIDALNTATLDWHISWQIYIYIDNAHIPMADGPPWPIEHRCLAYCYTKLGTSNDRSI